MLSFAWRVMDIIAAEVRGVDDVLVAAGSIGGVPICQILIDSLDAEMREEEENVMEVT